ncbi:hypothetical protein TIFTF001_004444 [Ficus carica]|uniref:Uncharacterized protein n=1 Tax=Ficus carica TaxID=3494 RepID=A0AA88DCW0_FICCA|nr:hypothetical protein TIFTF001_004444 [Ficus carica]
MARALGDYPCVPPLWVEMEEALQGASLTAEPTREVATNPRPPAWGVLHRRRRLQGSAPLRPRWVAILGSRGAASMAPLHRRQEPNLSPSDYGCLPSPCSQICFLSLLQAFTFF